MPIDMAFYMAERRRTRREALISPFGDVCKQCGSTVELHLDHIDPASKTFELSGAGLDRPWDRIMAEAAKCQLLCRVCHEAKTKVENTGRRGWNKDIGGPRVHGTPRCYQELPCHCESCKAAKRLYRQGKMTYRGELIDSGV